MTTVSGSFTGEGVSNHLLVLKAPQDLAYTISGTFTGKVYLERALTFAGLSWEVVKEFTGAASNQSYRSDPVQRYRFRGAVLSGTASYSIQDGDALFAEVRNPQNVLVAARTEGGDYIVGDLVVGGTLTVGGVSITSEPASESNPGLVELATQAEVNAGTDAERAVTPATLAGRTGTETRAGILELATDAETITGTDTARAITPANLTARTGTETRAGILELATDAETITGTDTARAITPANLAARTATTTRTGVVELATNAEAITGSDDTRAVTPAALAAALAAAAGVSPPWTVDATDRSGSWNVTANKVSRVDTSGGTSTATLPASFNVGDIVGFIDMAISFGTNNLTISRNGHKINGLSSNYTCDVSGVSCWFMYTGTTYGLVRV